jgi:hypothetical protein
MFLHIEFSAPKILFSNNFDELTDDDFGDLCQTLAKRLRDIGFFVSSTFIEQAEVKAIHYGKNIVFTDYTTASSVIADIAKSNITTRKEADIRAYKNNGETVHFFTANKGLAIYDKVAELNKSKKTEKGRIEKDNYCQLSLLDDYRPRKPFEILRIEARYNDHKAIKGVLAKTNPEIKNFIFQDLFSSKISQAVLKNEVAIIDDGLIGVLKNRQSVSNFTNDIVALNPKATLTAKMKAIAMKSLFIETGSRDIRKLIGANSSEWSRLVKDISKLRYQKSEITGMEVINEALVKFAPVKLQDYKDIKFEI